MNPPGLEVGRRVQARCVKLLIFAHKPPPHHGQSYMVELLLEGLGGDVRRRGLTSIAGENSGSTTPHSEPEGMECYHIDCRLSEGIEDIGRMRWGKLLVLLKYCLQAIGCRLRYGADHFYYVPAPGMRSAIYRDWIVMALCRPFFRSIIFHWHAVGLGAWLETEANRFERWMTRRLLNHSDLSIVLGRFYCADVEKLRPKRIEAVPNGIPDPCPQFETEVLPRRQARRLARAKLLRNETLSPQELSSAGGDPHIYHVLYLSLCMREKGIFDTVEAVAKANRRLMKEQSPLRVDLTVAGKFPFEREREEFEQRVAQADLNSPEGGGKGRVHYRGFVSGEEKKRLFTESDCFCFPTYYPLEGHPVSLLEAMAFDLPIVITRWRALPELFPESYPGLVEPRSSDQVAAILERFAREDPACSFREQFLAQFTEGRFLERMKQVLQQCGKE